MNNYILIKTEDKDSTFLIKGEKAESFEIFKISNIEDDKIDENKIIVNSINQQEALKKFRNIFPNLFKRSSKNYYEIKLIL